jgi:hypothetical protein
MRNYIYIIFALLISCAKSEYKNNNSFFLEKPEITSGEVLRVNSFEEIDVSKKHLVSLVNSNKLKVESYYPVLYKNYFIINRFLNQRVSSLENYSILIETDETSQNIPIQILPSLVIESFCGALNCSTLSGNVIHNTLNTINVSVLKIRPVRFVYTITTPYEVIEEENIYSTPTDRDWLNNVFLKAVPDDIGFYIANVNIKAYNSENEFVETSLPFKVVRPLEVKHFGKYELAEVYEPIPVTGCIPGTVGSNVQYSETESETRQNSVSININRSWSDSFSLSRSQTTGEGITVNETKSTINSSSMSSSETQSESYSNTRSEGESNNLSFNTSDGESWSWSLDESNSQTQGSAESQNTNTGLNGSTTVGVSGEGSLPFLAKASGKVEVSAGVSRDWGESNSSSNSETSSENRGYTTGGSLQTGRTYGSIQNDSRSSTLSGAYVLSSSNSNSISASSSLSSGRVWNMSESLSSGNVVTEGNSESIAQTVVNSSSSSTTFSYSGYIPRGRYGIFFRQTSRYVKLSEIITYNLNGFPQHAGFIMMNSWAWAPELSVSETCENAIISNLPHAECLIPPCGE